MRAIRSHLRIRGRASGLGFCLERQHRWNADGTWPARLCPTFSDQLSGFRPGVHTEFSQHWQERPQADEPTTQSAEWHSFWESTRLFAGRLSRPQLGQCQSEEVVHNWYWARGEAGPYSVVACASPPSWRTSTVPICDSPVTSRSHGIAVVIGRDPQGRRDLGTDVLRTRPRPVAPGPNTNRTRLVRWPIARGGVGVNDRTSSADRTSRERACSTRPARAPGTCRPSSSVGVR
ncbi:MAG: hypothetical protein JWL57_1343 [Actinobacteria bacterium]|nr:hypothetical protein [Actinomycetota bacterium]